MLPVDLPDTVRDALLAPLADHACHGVRRDELTRGRFELLLNEGGSPAPPGTTHFDTPLGAAVRRWCAPVLGLEPHAPPPIYLSRRAELGAAEVNRLLLRASGVSAFLADTGPEGADLLTAAEMGSGGEAAAGEVVRIEQIEQDVAEMAGVAVDYLDSLGDELSARAARAVALKTVVAGLCGLGLDPARPSRGAVLAAANRRLADPKQPLAEPALARHLLWSAADVARERGLPLQIHAGLGACDAGPHLADPALLTGFIRALQLGRGAGRPAHLLSVPAPGRLSGARLPARVRGRRARPGPHRRRVAPGAGRAAGAGPVPQAAVRVRLPRAGRDVPPGGRSTSGARSARR
ncbi:hypothetical protein ACFSTC_29935 [Nonomuraea ferruginea]